MQDKDAKYIGILYQEGRFYLFSPYNLLIDREKNLLRPLIQDEIIHHLLAHYNSFPKMIGHETPHVAISIAICNFGIVPKLLLEEVAASSSSSLVSPQLQFVDYILHRHTPASMGVTGIARKNCID